MASNRSASRLRPIAPDAGLHEVIASVRQLSYMKQHAQALLETLDARLDITCARSPVGRLSKGQQYELYRSERQDPSIAERLLEKVIWLKWRFPSVAEHAQSFHGNVCRFIQTYQMPLQGTRRDKGWGKVDLVGVTPDGMPVVIELKQERAKDTPLRMLAEALAYACAFRKAWNQGGLQAQWCAAMLDNGLKLKADTTLENVPLILLAPKSFWERAIGSPGKRSNGKVPEDAWPLFLALMQQCELRSYPVHCVQFETEQGTNTIVNVSAVRLPGMP